MSTTLAYMGDAFIHPTETGVRQYMRGAFRGALDRYDSLVFPIAGRFQLAECAIDAGWRAGEILCADTNLFSAVLGYMASGKDIAELEIEFPGDTAESQWARDKFAGGNHAAAVFLMLKLNNLRLSNIAERLVRNELWAACDHYGNQYQANAMRLTEKLSGLDYEVADVYAIASNAAVDEHALLCVDPGKLIGEPFACVGEPGNDRASITWKAPTIAPFEPKTGMDKLHHDLMPAAALAFFYWDAKVVPDALKERYVYVSERAGVTVQAIFCNRPDEARLLVKPRKETAIAASTIPVLAPGTSIEAGDAVQVVRASKEQVLYYADLWGCEPKGRIGSGFFVLVNGFIAGVVGMGFLDIRRSVGPWVSQVFGAYAAGVADAETVCALALTCEDSRKLFEQAANAPLYDVSEFRRVVRASAESMCWPLAACGLELKHRLRNVDGTHDLTYHGAFRATQWGDIAAEFLALPRDLVSNS